MKIGIVGGRNYINFRHVESKVSDFVYDNKLEKNFEIVSGGARGVDRMAEDYAQKSEVKFTCFPPDIKVYGMNAYKMRNEQIAKYCDVLLAFPDPNSSGTWMTIRFAFREGKKVIIYPYGD